MKLPINRRARLTAHVVLALAAIVFLMPMLVAVGVAMRGGLVNNLVTVLSEPLMLRFLLNSFIVAGGTIAVVLVAATLAAYAFVALPVRGADAILLAIVAATMIPPAAIFLPLFINVRALGFMNTLPAVIGPVSALTIPIMLLLIRSYLMSIPRALFHAAKMDGSNSLETLVFILLPMMRPILTVAAVWTFLAAWNEYFLPLVFLRRIESQVIILAPSYFAVDDLLPDVGLQFAALLLISLPTLILFLIFRRQLLEPVTAGAVK